MKGKMGGVVTFGKWRFIPSNLTLVGGGAYDYEIDLEKIRCSAEMLDWIFQIAGKNWADRDCIADLISAFHALFDPQGTLCSWGKDHKIDPVKVLRQTGFTRLDIQP